MSDHQMVLVAQAHWQQYWWRLLFRADGEPGWTVIGPEPVSRSGDLLLECYDEPDSRRVRLPGS